MKEDIIELQQRVDTIDALNKEIVRNLQVLLAEREAHLLKIGITSDKKTTE